MPAVESAHVRARLNEMRTVRRTIRSALGVIALATLSVSCGNDGTAPDEAGAQLPRSTDAPVELFPDVVDATAIETDPGVWTFSATLSSPYDTPTRYADAWRVLAPDGTVLGVRELLHDHADEQPFTRTLTGVEVPSAVNTVVVEGRDQVSGWGGATVAVSLDR